jgi:hypothetical protein
MIFSKLALEYAIFFNIQKGQKWPNGQTIKFFGKQFQTRPNLDDLVFKRTKSNFVECFEFYYFNVHFKFCKTEFQKAESFSLKQ